MDDVTYDLSATTVTSDVPFVSYWLYALAGVMCLISVLIGCGFACTQFCKACLFSYPVCQRGARSLKTNPVMRWLRMTRECLLGGRCRMEEEDVDDDNIVHPEVVVDADTRTEVERSIELYSPPPPYLEALSMPRPLNPLPSANPNYVIGSLSDVNLNTDTGTVHMDSMPGEITSMPSVDPSLEVSSQLNSNSDHVITAEPTVNSNTDTTSTISRHSDHEINTESSADIIREVNSEPSVNPNHEIISVATSPHTHEEMGSVNRQNPSQELTSVGLSSVNSNYEMNSLQNHNHDSTTSTLTNVS